MLSATDPSQEVEGQTFITIEALRQSHMDVLNYFDIYKLRDLATYLNRHLRRAWEELS